MSMKTESAPKLAKTKGEMKRLMVGSLRRIQKLPELVKSFSHQSGCWYIHA